MLDQDQVGTINIGARDANHLNDNLQVFSIKLDGEDVTNINQVLAKKTGPLGDVYGGQRGKPGCTGRG